MRQHLISVAIAAAVAGGIAAYAPAQKVTRDHIVIAPSKHAWPDLTDGQKAALAATLRQKPFSAKIDIVCNDAGCSDLATDIDDAAEDAGIESQLDKAIGPLGYGIGVQANEFDKAAAQALIAALDEATGGALKAQLVAGKSPAGYVTLLIGKHPRAAK